MHLSFALLLVAAPASDEPFDMLEEIMVRGERQPPNEEVLTMREVRESAAVDVAEALEMVEGITIVRRGAIANDLVLRGMQRDNIAVQMDGQPIFGACPNRMDPPAFHFDFAEVATVRIQKGPYCVRQPGCLAGTVELKGRNPSREPSLELHGGWGAYQSRNLSATASIGAEAGAGMLGYAYKDSQVPLDGNGRALTQSIAADSPHRYVELPDEQLAYVVNTAWTRVQLDLSERARSTIGYAYQDAQDVLYPFLLMDARYDTSHRVSWSLDVEEPGPRLGALHAQVFWDRVDHLMDNSRRQISAGTPEGRTMRSDADVGLFGARLVGDLAVADGTLAAGFDMHRRSWDVNNRLYNKMAKAFSEQPMVPDVLSQAFGLFADYRQSLMPKLKLRGGLRLDLVHVSARGLNPDRLDALYQPYYAQTLATQQEVTPVGGYATLTWRPTSGAELFFGLARSTRAPDPQELFIGIKRMSSNWVGNPRLEAVTNHQVDVGAKLFSKRFHLSASAFFSETRDLIYVTDLQDPDGDGPLIHARSFDNVDARLAGGELGGQVALPFDLFVKASLSYVWGEQAGGAALAEIPPLAGAVALRYDIDWLFVEISESGAAKQSRVDADLGETPTAGWVTTDLRLGARWQGLALIVNAANLLDTQYVPHLSYLRDPFASGTKLPELGRHVMATFSYSL